jgi:hypothetical protein
MWVSRFFSHRRARLVDRLIALLFVLGLAMSCSDAKPGHSPEEGGGQCARVEFPPRPQSDCVIPPAPPQACPLPSGGTRVKDVEALEDALADRSAQDIILADGVYDRRSALMPAAPHRLWGETPAGRF